jgi:hypothetical protein
VKLLGYRIFDPVNAEPKPEAKAELKTQAESELEPKAEAEIKPVVEPQREATTTPQPETKAKAEPQPKAKTPSDLTPQIVKRVHELYEELGREDVRAVEDLERAKRENQKDESHK